MFRAKKIAQWGLIGCGGLLAAVALAVALGFGWLRSDSGRDWLARTIEDAVSTPGEMELSIGALEGSLPENLQARDIVLRDAAGPWLTVAALDLDWQPWSLLGGILDVEHLKLTGVALPRLPASGGGTAEEAAGNGVGVPDIPLQVRIGRFAADEIALGAPVLGQAARFTLAGEAGRRDDGSLSTRFDLVRLDGIETRLLAALRYTPADDTLKAEIDATEAPGGLLASLLERPDLPRTELHLNGDGPLADWTGNLTLTLGDLADAQAAIGLARAGRGDLAFRLQGHSTVNSPPDAAAWSLLAGTTDIELQGAWRDDSRLHVDRLTAHNGNLDLAVSGDVAPAGGALDLKLTANARDGAALAALLDLDGLGALSADIALSGTTSLPQARLALRAEGLTTPDFAAAAITAAGRVTAERDLLGPAPRLALDLQGQVDTPRLPGEDAVNQVLGDALAWQLAGALDLDSGVLDVAALDIANEAAHLTATGPFNVNDGSGTLDAAAEVGALTALQPLTDIQLGGRARLAGPLRVERYFGKFAAELQGRWEQPSSDIGLIAAAAGKGLDLTARFSVDGARVAIDEATARSATTDAKVSLVVDGDMLRDGRYTLALSDAAVLAEELGVATAGKASATGTLSGPLDALDLGGTAQLERLTIEGQTLSALSGSYRLRLKGADIDGPVTAALTSPFGPAQAAAELQVREDSVTLVRLQAGLPQTTVTGALTVPLDDRPIVADLSGEIADLRPWLEIAGLSGGGKGSVTLQWNAPGAAAPVVAAADFSRVSLLPDSGAAPVRADRLTVNLQAQDPAFTDPGEIKVAAETLRWNRLTLKRLDAAGKGTASALDITVKADGKWIEPVALTAAGRVSRQDGTLTVALSKAEGRMFGQPLALRDTATLTLGPAGTRLDNLALASGDTTLTADALLGDGRIAVTAALDALPLTTVDAFWESGLDGVVSAAVNIDGSFDAPQGKARLTASGLRPRDSKDVPELQLTTSADWQGGRLKAEGQLGGAEVASARFAADAPLRMTAGGGIEIPAQEPLSGRLDWTGDIKTLLLFVPLPEHRLDGEAQIAVTVGGTAGAPQANGTLALENGRYESLEAGTLLRDLAVTAEVTDDKVTLASLSANDGAGGKLRGAGTLDIDPDAGFPVDISVTLDKFLAVRRDDVTAVTSGKVKLDGNLETPHVEGRFTTESVEVSLLANLPPNVVSLDVIETRNGEVQPPPEEVRKAPPTGATLDIVIEMPRRVFVRGRGLDSEWAGQLSVQGPAAAPVVTGEINLVRGQLSVVSKSFTLSKGKVILPKGADTEPSLDVTAVHKGKNLTVTAHLGGPLSKPELELSSVPEVPRDEIVSRVLFGKSAAELSGAEAAQLAIALRDLTGQGGSADILGFARRVLGVDVLQIETAEGTTPAVKAGKYLTEEVYVGVKQGATTQSSGAGVEVEVTPNITVESEVTGSGANKSGVRFQLDY